MPDNSRTLNTKLSEFQSLRRRTNKRKKIINTLDKNIQPKESINEPMNQDDQERKFNALAATVQDYNF